MISSDQLKAALQSLLMILGMLAVSKGWLTMDQANTVQNEALIIIGALMTIGGAVGNHLNADPVKK